MHILPYHREGPGRNCHRWRDWIVPLHCHQRGYYFKLAYKFKPGQMDLSHSSRRLPGRLAVLVLRDGDKTPVVVLFGGEGPAWDGRRRRRTKRRRGRRNEWVDGFPEMLRCFAINFLYPTVSNDDEAPSRTLWVAGDWAAASWWFTLFGMTPNNTCLAIFLVSFCLCLRLSVSYSALQEYGNPVQRVFLGRHAIGQTNQKYATTKSGAYFWT